MSGLRSYEGDYDHAGKSEFGVLLLRLRERNGETIRQQAVRLGFSAGYVKMSGSRSGEKLGRPSLKLRAAVVKYYSLTGDEREFALGRCDYRDGRRYNAREPGALSRSPAR